MDSRVEVYGRHLYTAMTNSSAIGPSTLIKAFRVWSCSLRPLVKPPQALNLKPETPKPVRTLHPKGTLVDSFKEPLYIP